MHISAVTCSDGRRRSAGFWAVTPTAQATAASRHSSTPVTSVPAERVVATPINTAPANATPAPTISQRGKPSPSRPPASSAMRIGPVLTSIAAVPASTCSSAAFSATLYTANHVTPQTATSTHSRPEGRIHARRASITASSATAPTTSRPSASAPGLNASPRARIATNADAHAMTVTSTAASTSPGRRVAVR